MLDGTKESPTNVPNKSRRTLMSPQECQIAQCSLNQLEMTTNSPALDSEQCRIPDHTGRLAWLPLGNSRDSLRRTSQVYRNTNFILGTPGKVHALHIVSRRADSQDFIKEVAHIPTTLQEEPSLSNRYVRGTLNLWRHVQWIPRFPESKESRISLQWLECTLVFFSQYKGMSEYSVQSLEKTLCPTSSGQGASHHLTLREAHGVQYFERGRGLTLLEN